MMTEPTLTSDSFYDEEEHQPMMVSGEQEDLEEHQPMMNAALTTERQAPKSLVLLEIDQEVSAAKDDEFEEFEEATIVTTPTSNRRSGRRSGGWTLQRPRMGAPSWWTECRNIETTGCTFVLAYIILSFFLMTTMFNMREIVGDYLLGNTERTELEYRHNVKQAMELRRRAPWETVDQEDRFEKESEANLFYDRQGQLGDDTNYLRHHRVPIIRPADEEGEKEDDADEEADP